MRGNVMWKRIIVGLCCIFGVACSPVSIKTKQFLQRDYTTVHSYAWKPDNWVNVDTPVIDRLAVDKVIQDGIDRILQRKGLKQHPVAQADVLVHYTADIWGDNVQEEQQYRKYAGNDPFSTRGGSIGKPESGVAGIGPPRLHDYGKAKVVVEIFDAKNSTLLWRGSVTSPLDVLAEDKKIQQDLQNLLERLFHKFPPS